ncbi:MAG: lipoprotein [Chitinophagaceae bacterium]|nr:lipoprotein [Chitinophagaceae bacterium]
MRKIILIIILSFVLTGCQTCIRGLYGVHEEPTFIKIPFKVDGNQYEAIKKFADSTNAVQNDSFKTAIKLLRIEKDYRVLCFSNPSCECYLLSLKKEEIIIHGVFLPKIAPNEWILTHQRIENIDLERCKIRFERDVLDKVNQ